jgi:hypothetical protein
VSLFILHVVWGTKSRARALGIRATFCGSCLEVRKFKVYAIEKSDHIYLISVGGWRENLRYQECEVCQAQVQVSTDAPLIPEEVPDTRSAREILQLTNSAGETELVLQAEKTGHSVPPEEKKRSTLRTFLVHQLAQLKQAEENTGGWTGLVLLLFIAVGIAAFLLRGVAFGIAAAVGLLVLLFWIQSRLIHRSAETVIEPRLPRFFEGSGISWKEFEAHLEGEPGIPGKLRRHFRRSRYSPYREGTA